MRFKSRLLQVRDGKTSIALSCLLAITCHGANGKSCSADATPISDAVIEPITAAAKAIMDVGDEADRYFTEYAARRAARAESLWESCRIRLPESTEWPEWCRDIPTTSRKEAKQSLLNDGYPPFHELYEHLVFVQQQHRAYKKLQPEILAEYERIKSDNQGSNLVQYAGIASARWQAYIDEKAGQPSASNLPHCAAGETDEAPSTTVAQGNGQ